MHCLWFWLRRSYVTQLPNIVPAVTGHWVTENDTQYFSFLSTFCDNALWLSLCSSSLSCNTEMQHRWCLFRSTVILVSKKSAHSNCTIKSMCWSNCWLHNEGLVMSVTRYFWLCVNRDLKYINSSTVYKETFQTLLFRLNWNCPWEQKQVWLSVIVAFK